MIRNYFKTAIRNLLRNKSYAIINVVGLAVGIAVCLLIFLVVQFETSFDNFHQQKNIYRVVSEEKTAQGVSHSSGVPFPVAEALRIDHPELKNVARIYQVGNDQITVEEEGRPDKKFNEERSIFFAEPQFFEIFSFPFIAGDPKTALKESNTAVITKQSAQKYFGNWQSAIGKTLEYENRLLIKVTGVIDDIPANSDFPLGVVMSFETLKNTGVRSSLTDWVSIYSQSYCFIVLPNNVSEKNFNSSLAKFVKKHKPAENVKEGLILSPLAEMHFDDRLGNFNGRTFGRDIISALTIIGLFLLVIACVNFINLATAQAVNRSKEVGVRKVLGSNKLQIAIQFMSETALITGAAVVLAVIISLTALPFLNELLQLQLSSNFVKNPEVLLFIVTITIAVVFLSGFYPALVLSGFNPITAIKSRITPKMVGGISLRRALVVLQFAIAQVLIIGMLIVVSQVNYFQNATLGFDKDALIDVPIPSDSASRTKMEAFHNQLRQHPGIKKVSFAFTSPSDGGSWNSDFNFDGSSKSAEVNANLKWADVNYFSTYNLEMAAGRVPVASDTIREYVVNETLAKRLGFTNPNDILGKRINLWNRYDAPIVGVVKDFHANSLRDPIGPVLIAPWKSRYRQAGVKIDAKKTKETLAFIESLWNKTYPEYVYQYRFLDEKIANFYAQENQLSQLYKIFAGIAIFISCLGLYGLVSFMAVQRTKEVGIRKVLGATTRKIVYLFSREFTLLIGVAFLIAVPVAYYIMNNWLQNFTYRIDPGVGIFAIAVVLSITIAWITVGYRAVRAALANPVKSLRTE